MGRTIHRPPIRRNNGFFLFLTLFVIPLYARPFPFIIGADVSWVPEYEARGQTFSDNGPKMDALQIFKNHKFNWIRLRIFYNPLAPGGYSHKSLYGGDRPFCGLGYTINMAKRVRAMGMNLLLALNYSDTWTNPGTQQIPNAWQGNKLEALSDSVYAYTTHVLTQMKENGVLPQMVQVGNEINNGLLKPTGQNIQDAAVLVASGLRAVRHVDTSIYTMVHSATGNDNATTTWFMKAMIKGGEPIDALGLSCYTQWHGAPGDWELNFNQLSADFPDYGLLIVEYSHEKLRAHEILYNLPNKQGWGAFIWEPITWMEKTFDYSGGNHKTNALMDYYPEISDRYGSSDVDVINPFLLLKRGHSSGGYYIPNLILNGNNPVIKFGNSLSDEQIVFKINGMLAHVSK